VGLVHDDERPVLLGELEDARGIGRELPALHGLDPARHHPGQIGKGNTDRLGPDVEPDQRRARGKHPGEVGRVLVNACGFRCSRLLRHQAGSVARWQSATIPIAVRS
jgi:hypothetical protein